MANDSAGKNSLAAMAAILGASIGMNISVADAHGIAASNAAPDVAGAAGASPITLAQEINVRPGGSTSGGGASPRTQSQLKFQKWAPTQLKFHKISPAPRSGGGSSARATNRSMNIVKVPAPPAPPVPIPYPNMGSSQIKSKTSVRAKTPTVNKNLIIRKR